MPSFTNECRIEIKVGIPFQTDVISEQKSDEDAGDHDVPQAKHREVGGVEGSVLEQVLYIINFVDC